MTNNEKLDLSLLSPEALSKALSVLLQAQKLEQETEQEVEVENEQDAEQDAELKGKFEVYNGNSYVKNSGNSKSYKQVDNINIIIIIILFFFGGGVANS